VKDLPKYMTIWGRSQSAPWPTDPAQAKQLDERTFAFIDEALKSGRILEVGWFAEGTSGYSISPGEDAKGILTGTFATHPWAQYEVQEIIDHETAKETELQVLEPLKSP